MFEGTMASGQGVLGTFSSLGDLLRALEALRESGAAIHTVFSPVPSPEIQRLMAERPSPVRLYTLAGGLAGLATGLGLAVYAGLQWGFVTSGKPVVALIPFTIVGFEFTILFGILGNLAGMLIHGRLFRFRLPKHYDKGFSRDRFGVYVDASGRGKQEVERLLREAGAEAIHVV